jgi:hypothetical protein
MDYSKFKGNINSLVEQLILQGQLIQQLLDHQQLSNDHAMVLSQSALHDLPLCPGYDCNRILPFTTVFLRWLRICSI